MPEKTAGIQCCQSSVSLGSEVMDEPVNFDNGISCEKDALAPLNNNVIIPVNLKSHYVFPKRQKVDVEFSDLTFTSSSWSMTKFQKGKPTNC